MTPSRTFELAFLTVNIFLRLTVQIISFLRLMAKLTTVKQSLKVIAQSKAIAFAKNAHLGSQIENAKNMPKTILQEHCVKINR